MVLMTDDLTVSGSFAEVISDYLQACALPAPQVLEILAPYETHQRIPLCIFEQALEHLHQVQPVPALGVRVGRCIKPEHFGVVGYLAASCSSLGQALTRYRRFQTLLITDLAVQVKQVDAVMQFRWQQKTGLLCSEFGAAAFINLYQALIGKVIPPLIIELPHAKPRHAEIYDVLMGCPVRFNAAQLGIDIPVPLMAMRIATSDAYLRNLFDQQASALLATSPHDDVFLTKLKGLLVEALQGGEPSAADMATRMDYSLRSFYRELSRLGLRYRALLGDTRFQLARLYLADPRLSTVEIALLLGYSEHSAFTRAFRGWSGSTPTAYRKHLKGRAPI